MRLSVKGLAAASAIVWGGAILLTGLAHLVWPDYGTAFLDLAASIYPGYETDSGIGGVITGSVYGLVDGAVCGAIFAWIYNLFAGQ